MNKLLVVSLVAIFMGCSGGKAKPAREPAPERDPEPEREMYVPPTDLSGPPDAPGKLPMTEVEAHMSDVLATIKECADDSTYEGKVSVRVTILPDGTASAELIDISGEPLIDECMMDAFRGVTFPTSDRGQRFSYSYTF